MKSLEQLRLGNNYFSRSATTKIVSSINNSPSKENLMGLHLQHCIWDDLEACQSLVEIIASAVGLEEVNIIGQNGSSKIRIELKENFVVIKNEEETVCEFSCSNLPR